MQEAARQCGETAVADTAAAQPLLERETKPGRTIFLKGSRGMKLETLVPPENQKPESLVRVNPTSGGSPNDADFFVRV
jgi:hypothetical protein